MTFRLIILWKADSMGIRAVKDCHPFLLAHISWLIALLRHDCLPNKGSLLTKPRSDLQAISSNNAILHNCTPDSATIAFL